ncbi:MAG: elongation factor P [Bacteroidetes bacterium GWE2_29_8]|nr:MAG: elongation factor P [Bacteroidetes bacterium GWE2_29_8]OFY22329.1 MAG: elongation factor P [Bacteroidetes bacterium GWF2_29_10]
MANTSDLKNGICIEFNNDLYSVVEFQHVKPGKGGAFVRTKLKNLKTGRVIANTFNAGVKINVVRMEKRQYQFLYKDDIGYNFMNLESFEQISIEEVLIENPKYLKEGQEVDILLHAETETPLSCELPPFVVMEIVYAEPGLKGDTANTALKQATTETGLVVNVPLFVNQGEKIKVDTRSGDYVERVK